MPGLRLKVLSGPAEGTTIPLGGDPLSIGRDTLAGDPEASHSHARVFERDGRHLIEDLGSTNGTFVNGIRIEGATELGPGDTARLGTSTLEIEAAAAVLEALSGPGAGLRLPLWPEPLAIGRGEEADARLEDDPELSRRHARVSADRGRVTIDDLGSRHGTFVNG